MTSQLGVIYMLHFDQPYKHARHYVGWTDDLLDRLDTARQRARRSAGRRHLASRYRLHPGPHLRRHPPHRTRHQERRRRGPVLPGLHPPAMDRPLAGDARRLHPPHLPQPRRKAVTPMPKTNGSGRNQRNNPYQLEELFVKFHRTPAGIAWRWRTELPTLAVLAAAWWRLDTWTTLIWAGIILAGLLGRGPGRAALPPVHHPARPGASWPGTASSGCATKPGCTPAPGGSRSSCGPGRPRSGNAPGCCAAQASAPRTSTTTSASCAPPATPATRGSPATAAGPTW